MATSRRCNDGRAPIHSEKADWDVIAVDVLDVRAIPQQHSGKRAAIHPRISHLSMERFRRVGAEELRICRHQPILTRSGRKNGSNLAVPYLKTVRT